MFDARLMNETPKAAAAFARYCAMGTARSLAKVAENSTANVRQFERWSTKYHWVDRVAQYDADQREIDQLDRRDRERRRAQARDDLDDLHALIYAHLERKVLRVINDKLDRQDYSGLSILVRVLALALKEERRALAPSPDAQAAISAPILTVKVIPYTGM